MNFIEKPFFEYNYLKAKVRDFDGVIKTNFLGNDILKENMHYACIAWITINSVMRIDKKKIIHTFIKKSKYGAKKIQMSRFINTELKWDSDLDSDSSDLDSEKIGQRLITN